MSYLERDVYGMYKTHNGPGPNLMGAGTLAGEEVCNQKGESLGNIKEIMLDMRSGKIAYAVLSFGGFLSMGEKLFAVPWKSLYLDTASQRFVLDIEKERLFDAPGFEKDHWPDMGNVAWADRVHSYYRAQPYYEFPQ